MAMSRPRGGGAAAPNRGRSGGVRPVYEEFRPISEWQEDDESHILTLYLPGFMKEQIRVSTEGQNTIRVRGERLVAGNKWSRFQEDFQVPENAEMNSIRAKYQAGMLNITVPKKNVGKAQEALPPKAKTSGEPVRPPTPHPGQEKTLPTAAPTSQKTEEKSPEPTKRVLDDRAKKVGPNDVQSHEQKSTGPTGSAESVGQQEAEPGRKESSQLKERAGVTKEMAETEDKNLVKRKDLPEEDIAKMMNMKKDGPADGSEQKLKDKESKGKETTGTSNIIGAGYGGLTVGKYKKAVKNLSELNEERQLLMNMGVAVLVIMALSAYVTYKFASGKDNN